MNILLVYPIYPDSFWSYKHALGFISKKAAVPPLGLITVSALLPLSWHKKLVDMNVTTLLQKDILWADYVFISAMYIQKASVDNVIEACRKAGVKVVAGGPLFTQEYQNYPDIDHFVLNEAEITMPLFLQDIASGKVPQKVYSSDEFADINLSPVPDYHLLSRKDYAFMNIQVSRGCPYACEFCEITTLLGHKVRMKKPAQVVRELEALYKLNWRGSVFIVDDNFIGNKHDIKTKLLPLLILWMQAHRFPFSFNTQTSINLADDEELLKMMTEAGFSSTFIGIETTDEESLEECNKIQNRNRNMLQSIHTIQRAGLIVSGGFIVGFDKDPPTVFREQIEFIQKSGIVSAMVGLLNAPKNTKLYKRLEAEDRLINEGSGNNTDQSMNFIPRMNNDLLLEGYKMIIQEIYTTKPYYDRIRKLLLNYEPPNIGHVRISSQKIMGFLKSVIILGLLKEGRREYWRFLFWTLRKRPGSLADAIEYTIYGFHYRTVFGL